MDLQRKKELLEAYKFRKPEMGIVCMQCEQTGACFLGISKDTTADYNSNSFKLKMGSHPNKQLQALWNTYGEAGVTWAVLEVLKYEDPHEDQTKELEKLLDKWEQKQPEARRIWR